MFNFFVAPQQISKAPSLTFGGAVTLAEAMVAMEAAAAENPKLKYAKEMATHWGKVANTAVRCAGTLAGNLMLKHNHKVC